MNLPPKKTVVFHPGIGKTATSTIQEIGLTLDCTQTEATCMCPYGLIGGANNAFSTNHPLFKKENLEDIINDSISFILTRNAPTLISSEFLIRQPSQDTKKLLQAFLSAGINIKVFIGIRRYDDLMLSSYLQALKVQYGKLENESLTQYIQRELPSIRYPELIEPWAEVAGKENILLFNFNEGRQSFVYKFYSALGVDIKEKNLHTKKANPSLPIESMEIINTFDTVCQDTTTRTEILKLLISAKYKDEVKENYIKISKDACGNTYETDYRILLETYKLAL